MAKRVSLECDGWLGKMVWLLPKADEEEECPWFRGWLGLCGLVRCVVECEECQGRWVGVVSVCVCAIPSLLLLVFVDDEYCWIVIESTHPCQSCNMKIGNRIRQLEDRCESVDANSGCFVKS